MRDLLKNYDFEKRVKITQRISAIYEKMSNSEEYMKQKEKGNNNTYTPYSQRHLRVINLPLQYATSFKKAPWTLKI